MKKQLIITSLCLLSLFSVGCDNKTNSYESYNSRKETPGNDQNADWQITTRVKSAIMRDSKLSSVGRFISVETNDGVVTLTGNVRSQDESDYVERRVLTVQGVQRVDNQLTIAP